jgi:hypothetical protein
LYTQLNPWLERECHVIGKDKRRRSGTSFASVDRNEVDTPTRRRHLMGQVAPEPHITHSRLNSHWKAHSIRDVFHKIKHAVDVAEGAMAVGTVTGLPFGNATNPCDFGSHFRRGQDTS